MSTSIPESVLMRMLTGQTDLSATSLATRILVSRLRRELSANPASISAKVRELSEYFGKHTFANKDLSLL